MRDARLQRLALSWILLVSGAVVLGAPARFDFAGGTEGWTAAHGCTIAAADGILRATSTDVYPFLHSPEIRLEGPVVVRLRARFSTFGPARLYWRALLPSLVSSSWSESRVVYFNVLHDRQWHEIAVPLDVDSTVTQIRLDPGRGPGVADIDWLAVEPLTPTPRRRSRSGKSLAPCGCRAARDCVSTE